MACARMASFLVSEAAERASVLADQRGAQVSRRVAPASEARSARMLRPTSTSRSMPNSLILEGVLVG